MKIGCTNTMVAGMNERICQQLEVGGIVVYPLASGRSFETDFMVSLDEHISITQATLDSFKTNSKGKRDASTRLEILQQAKGIVQSMGDYHNVNSEIVKRS